MGRASLYLKNYGMMLVFLLAMVLLNSCMQHFESQWLELFVNGCISVGISVGISILVIMFDKKTRRFILVRGLGKHE